MKKFLLLLLATTALIACNDDNDDSGLPAGYVYASSNTGIYDGFLQGHNLQFFGLSTVTDPKGGIYTDTKALFEFAGADKGTTIYMHNTRFAAVMPPAEMRIYKLPYTGVDNTIAFESTSVVPEALVPATGAYTPVPRYVITALEGSINGVVCKTEYTCIGLTVQFDGQLIVKK